MSFAVVAFDYRVSHLNPQEGTEACPEDNIRNPICFHYTTKALDLVILLVPSSICSQPESYSLKVNQFSDCKIDGNQRVGLGSPFSSILPLYIGIQTKINRSCNNF